MSNVEQLPESSLDYNVRMASLFRQLLYSASLETTVGDALNHAGTLSRFKEMDQWLERWLKSEEENREPDASGD